MESGRFDVVAVKLDTSEIRLIAEDKDEENAKAIVTMAVVRRGCDTEFFAEVPHGAYEEGDKWYGKS